MFALSSTFFSVSRPHHKSELYIHTFLLFYFGTIIKDCHLLLFCMFKHIELDLVMEALNA